MELRKPWFAGIIILWVIVTCALLVAGALIDEAVGSALTAVGGAMLGGPVTVIFGSFFTQGPATAAPSMLYGWRTRFAIGAIAGAILFYGFGSGF